METISFEKQYSKAKTILEEQEENESCGICLLEFDELEKIKILGCKVD